MADSTREERACSFCGKREHEVRKLISGPRTFICDECIVRCHDILADEGFFDEDKIRKGVPYLPCSLCGIALEPEKREEWLFVGGYGMLCPACTEHVRDALNECKGP